MKVYRVKPKARTKRYFRRGVSQRYVDMFTGTYTTPIETQFQRVSVQPQGRSLTRPFLILMLLGFSAVTVPQLVKNVDTAAISRSFGHATASFQIPALPVVNLPKITPPTVTFPELPEVTSLRVTIGKALYTTIQSVAPVIIQIGRLLNPAPLVTFIAKLSNDVLGVSVIVIQRIASVVVTVLQTIIKAVIGFLPRLNPVPLFVLLGRVLGSVLSFIGSVIVTSVRFIVQSIFFIGSGIFRIVVFTGTFLWRVVTVTVQFTFGVTVTIVKTIVNVIVYTLHLLDPRPLLFRIGSAIHSTFSKIGRAIKSYVKQLWDLASPPFVFLWNGISWSVQKSVNDLKVTPKTQQVQAEEVTEEVPQTPYY